MKEYRYQNALILGIDHGYGNMKTAHRVFKASVEKEPTIGANILGYNGIEYGIGAGHKEFQVEKIGDEDYLLLTFASIGYELHFRGLQEADIYIAAGVPLFWVKEQKVSFKEYLLQKEKVEFSYKGRKYCVRILGVEIFPQGYSAFLNEITEAKGQNVLADIGNGTMNVAFMNKNIPIPGKLFTEQFGTYQCMKESRNELIKECKVEVPDEIIDEVFRYGNADIPDKYISVIQRVAKEYTNKVFQKLREYGYHADLQKLYFVGGGSCLIKNFAEYDRDRVYIIDDICATAKGYEFLMSQKLYRKAV